MTRRMFLLAAIVTLFAGIGVPASAGPPETDSFEFVDEFTDVEACGFPIDFRFVGDGSERRFFDQAGNLRRVTIKFSDNGTATNPANGKSASGHDSWTVIVDFEDGVPDTVTLPGLTFHFNVPGAGIVLIDAGRVVFDSTGDVVVLNGPHQFLEGDFSRLCTALS
jgi:hypothetical protein